MKTSAECEDFRRKFREELDKPGDDFDPSEELLEHPNNGCESCLKWLEDLYESESEPSVGDDLDSSKILKN